MGRLGINDGKQPGKGYRVLALSGEQEVVNH